MKHFARFALCGALFAACSPLAFADSVSLSGNVNFDPAYATFSSPFSTGSDTGYFAPFANGSVQYLLGTVPYMAGVLGGTEETFTITNTAGDVLAYYNQSNAASQSYDSQGNLDVTLDETGYYTIDGGQQQSGFFTLTLNGTSPTGAASNVSFLATGGLQTPVSPTVGVAPEPSSVLLMATGMLGVLGIAAKQRRKAQSGLA